ncbi:hypothetical protein HOLleu_07252 [Holothuria leucospilota]|uniref:C-type lectin domain-containing protein n=1 Tax=Holothuria leucospilota TaxID=206669 RepID=A0A9Q1HGV8_HOLLE|nr:hypothetical protein HOLleu_07252 [Holothuria leucospilota]
MATLLYFLLILTLSAVVFSQFRCHFPWKEYNGRCYFFSSDALTFKDAELFCRRTTIGECRFSRLASVKDVEEFRFIRDLAFEKMLKPVAFYMGGYATPECTTGTWTDQSTYPIAIGDGASDNSSDCGECDFEDQVAMEVGIACDISKCMVANFATWFGSLDEGNFTAFVADHLCHEIQLPFVCKSQEFYN